ncbi:hypothetical protein [Novosphingobium decolorationis]|uniref:Urea transporter n=1 Tax=Novosphingobium decolorationis TaxID=2698673 RepID=A0ABX8E2M3_9SPHN|nr:hypothetical protein [Novosphingobium decolorationis]QVM83377.1 hypothetical protein HT578_06445 [Novosphingobium decolorationis]
MSASELSGAGVFERLSPMVRSASLNSWLVIIGAVVGFNFEKFLLLESGAVVLGGCIAAIALSTFLLDLSLLCFQGLKFSGAFGCLIGASFTNLYLGYLLSLVIGHPSLAYTLALAPYISYAFPMAVMLYVLPSKSK